jgi:hypothetical protein
MLTIVKPSKTAAVTLKGATATFERKLDFDGTYRLHATAPCWVTQGFGTSTATPTRGEPGSMPLAAGESVHIAGSEGDTVSVLGDKGVVTITPIKSW